MTKRTRQAGMTLVELLLATVVSAAMLTAFGAGFKQWDRRQSAISLAEVMAPVARAADAYRIRNWTALQAAGATVAGFANALAPTTAELQAAGLLSDAWRNGSNLLNANVLVAITRSPVGCAAPNCIIAYTVYLDRPWRDDTGRADIQSVASAASALANGGFSTLASPNQLTSRDGSWTTPNPVRQAGVLAAFDGGVPQASNTGCATLTPTGATFGDAANPCTVTVVGDSVVRGNSRVQGRLTASDVTVQGRLTVANATTQNTLTAANISTQNTASINRLNGNLEVTARATEGASCSPNGRIASDSQGLLLSCQSGLWRQASGGSQTGLQGMFYPLRGKTIRCTVPSAMTTGLASVDGNGNLTIGIYRHYWLGYPGGWIYCPLETSCGFHWQGAFGEALSAVTVLTPVGIRVSDGQGSRYSVCQARWPNS